MIAYYSRSYAEREKHGLSAYIRQFIEFAHKLDLFDSYLRFKGQRGARLCSDTVSVTHTEKLNGLHLAGKYYLP